VGGLLIASALSVVACRPPAEAHARWNVLVLVPDTVRGDHLSINGYFRETTPRLDALARDGINFTQAVTVAPRTWQSFSSILTGLYPPHHGVRFIYDRSLDPQTPIIASVLGERGYHTAAFDVMPFLETITNGEGFDEYFTAKGRPKGTTLDEALAERLVRWVGRQPHDTPYLAFVRFSGGHWPYKNGRWAHQYFRCDDCSHAFNLGAGGLRAERGAGFVLTDEEAYRRMIWPELSEREREHRIAHYDSELRALDGVVGSVLDRLERAGKLGRTVVLLTSDHGESFGEHGYLQHGPRVDEPVMRVPLVLHLPDTHPDHRRGVVVDELARVVDVFPTLLDLLGIPAPDALDGASLLPAIRGEAGGGVAAYGESGRSFMATDPERRLPGVEGKQRMLRSRGWKLVWTPAPDGGSYRLYDLESDPDEERDVAAQHPERVASLRARLEEIRATEKGRGAEREIAPEELEQLRRLGYLQ
jgi:arylsulfatase A-like enzyme